MKVIVEAAAQAWTDIANEWAVIILPGYLGEENEEYRERMATMSEIMQNAYSKIESSFGNERLRKL